MAATTCIVGAKTTPTTFTLLLEYSMLNKFEAKSVPGLVEFGTDGYLRRKSNSTGLISFFIKRIWKEKFCCNHSATKLGDLLHFGQLFKASGNNYYGALIKKPIILPKSPTLFGIFCKGIKIFHCSSEIIFWATFIDIWWLFSGHTGYN